VVFVGYQKVDAGLVTAIVRGDFEVNETKLVNALGAPGGIRPATVEEIKAAGMEPGYGSPIGARDTFVVIDDLVARSPNLVAGANREGFHYRNVNAGRDYTADVTADITNAQAGDACPNCGGQLTVQPAIEVGHIFKLGTFHSVALGATFLNEDGQEKPIVMGSYGTGPARTMAAIIEQHHDEQGIVWPESVAPYDVHVVVLPGLEEKADEVAAALEAAGKDVLLDDRDLRAGEKFADADLIGCPWRVTVGKKTQEGEAVDLRRRESGEERRVSIADLGGSV
jgi:prolyl-tRNA synthetase